MYVMVYRCRGVVQNQGTGGGVLHNQKLTRQTKMSSSGASIRWHRRRWLTWGQGTPLETITRSFNNYLSKRSFEDRLGRWLRAPVTPANPLDPPWAGLHPEVKALLDGSEEEGIIPALWDKNSEIISLIEYQDRKQSLGEVVVLAHEAFHSILDRALSAHDRVIREEETKASAVAKVRGAMDSLEQLFNRAKEFYVSEPSRDASAAVCFM